MKSNLLLVIASASLAFAGCATAQPTLKEAFKEHFLVGAALNESQFNERDAVQMAIIKKQFNTITPENVMKWARIHPDPERFDFGPADRYVEFGESNGMFIIGHTLVWHSQTPSWVFDNGKGGAADRDTLLARMSNHIHTVVGRYKGRVKGWDVVNEALNEDGSLRQSRWLKIIGKDYLIKAFEFAHAADPDAELYYNDFSLETPAKREGAVALVKNLQAAGAKIAGIGTQMHVKLDSPSAQAVDDTLTEFGKLGVKVMVTELDLDVLPAASRNRGADVSLRFAQNPTLNPYTNGIPPAIQQAFTERYASLFALYVKHSKVVDRITFWGVTDGDSWLNDWPIRGRTSYPLLFDRAGKSKQALSTVLETAKQTKTNVH